MALNESLEALKKLAAEVAQAATKFTKSAATVTKANFNILSEQEKLKKAYAELGKLYYRDYITGEEPDDAEYIPLCDAITEATKAIEDLKSQVEEAKKPKEEPEAEPVEEAAEEVCEDVEQAAEDLNKDLDELAKNLEDLKEPAEPVFEVVDDKPEEPKAE
jgi:archaellum component FlaC